MSTPIPDRPNDPVGGAGAPPRVAIAPIMAQVRQKARERTGMGEERDRAAYDELMAAFGAAGLDLPPRAPFYPQILGPDEDWEIPTPLTFETHRGRSGQALIWLKRRLLLPLNRWLYSYVWHNLHRQQRLNLRLLAAVEALAVSNGRLRRDVAELRLLTPPTEPPSPTSPPPPMPPSKATAEGGRKLNLAFVVDRYGPDVSGGSERHCRDFAERLALRGHTVTVLTSCAQDYVSWANAYPPGPTEDGPVTVMRFPVAAERDSAFWHAQSRRVFSGLGSIEDERRWFRESGPYVPELIEHLNENRNGHDLFIFFSYRYYPTFAGLPLVAPRAILVPTAEEDPAIRLKALPAFFGLPLGIVHNTIEEHALMRSVTPDPYPPFAVIGSGVDEPASTTATNELAALGVKPPYLLCLGRVDPNKGSFDLLNHFKRFIEQEGGDIQLVLAGLAVAPTPPQPNVVFLGHVTESQRTALLQNMTALVAPSPFESLSLSLLESWMNGRPALVNGQCRVLKAQVSRADGGLYYDNAAEFREALSFLLKNPDTARRLGRQGGEYARREYAWPVVMERLEAFLQARFASLEGA